MTDETGRTDSPDDSGQALPALEDLGVGGLPGFEGHEDAREMEVLDLAEVPADEIISRSIVILMSAAAEKLGLSDDDPASSEHLDLDEARKLITALAGLVKASAEWLGPRAGVVRDGLQGLQHAFREASTHPDPPGQGPGEEFTGKVY